MSHSYSGYIHTEARLKIVTEKELKGVETESKGEVIKHNTYEQSPCIHLTRGTPFLMLDTFGLMPDKSLTRRDITGERGKFESRKETGIKRLEIKKAKQKRERESLDKSLPDIIRYRTSS